jgi:hypothetical protein
MDQKAFALRKTAHFSNTAALLCMSKLDMFTILAACIYLWLSDMVTDNLTAPFIGDCSQRLDFPFG